MRNVVGVIKEIISFFNASSKRSFILKRVNKGKLIGICETRWVERHDALLQFKTQLCSIVESLNVVSSWEENETATKARSLLLSVSNTEFIITVFALSNVFAITPPLCRLLQ